QTRLSNECLSWVISVFTTQTKDLIATMCMTQTCVGTSQVARTSVMKSPPPSRRSSRSGSETPPCPRRGRGGGSCDREHVPPRARGAPGPGRPGPPPRLSADGVRGRGRIGSRGPAGCPRAPCRTQRGSERLVGESPERGGDGGCLPPLALPPQDRRSHRPQYS